MTSLPIAVLRAARAFGLDAESLRSLGGASGATWSDGRVVLRVGARVAAEVAAASAAAARVPVPRVLDQIELDGSGAVLLEHVRGRTAGELALADPVRAGAVGRACGALHERLAGLAAPPELPAAGGPGPKRSLLHLDLHPYNVIVGDDGEPAAVIDWTNAAAGDPLLDRARTWSILTLDPAALMLDDLAGRHPPAAPAHVRAALAQAETADRLSRPARTWP